MEKLKKTARGLDVFFKILFWVLAAAAAAMLIFDIVVLIRGLDFTDGSWRAFVGVYGVSFDLPQNIMEKIDFSRVFVYGMLLYFALLAGLMYGIHVIRRILKPMKEGQPFASSVSGDIRRLGWFSLICGAVGVIAEFAGKHMLKSLMYAAIPDGMSFNMTEAHHIDGTFFIITAFLFLFSYIFRYGEELQALSDETL